MTLPNSSLYSTCLNLPLKLSLYPTKLGFLSSDAEDFPSEMRSFNSSTKLCDAPSTTGAGAGATDAPSAGAGAGATDAPSTTGAGAGAGATDAPSTTGAGAGAGATDAPSTTGAGAGAGATDAPSAGAAGDGAPSNAKSGCADSGSCSAESDGFAQTLFLTITATAHTKTTAAALPISLA